LKKTTAAMAIRIATYPICPKRGYLAAPVADKALQPPISSLGATCRSPLIDVLGLEEGP
jgi:hypothetical protein